MLGSSPMVRRLRFAALVACLALTLRLGADSAFVGTWELTGLSREGRPRAGRGRLVVAPGRPGQPAEWAWDLAHQPRGDLKTTLKPGWPWPIIGRHTPSPHAGSYQNRGGDGVYRLEGDRLTVAWSSPYGPKVPAIEPFGAGLGRTIETYRRVRRGPDPSFRPSIFPRGPVKLIATWDEAGRGFKPNRYRGFLDHHAAYDLGDGVHMIRMVGTEHLDDPPVERLPIDRSGLCRVGRAERGPPYKTIDRGLL